MTAVRREPLAFERRPRPPAIPAEGVIDTDREPPVATRVDAYLSALEAGDVERAAQEAVAIETDPPPVGDLLTAFSDAVVANRVPEVRTLRRRLRRRYATRRPPERARFVRASLWAGARAGDPEQIRAVSRYGEQTRKALALREELFATAVPVRTIPIERTKRKRLRNLSARLAGRERRLAETADEVTGFVADADLPASVAVLDAVALDDTAPGEPATVRVAAANVGDAPASDVSLSASAGDASVDPSSVAIGTVDPATRVNVEVSVTPSSRGTTVLDLELTSADAGFDADSAVVWADDAVTSFPAAYDRNGDGLLNTDEIQRAVADFQAERPVPGTDDQTLDAEATRQMLVLWALDQPI